MALFLNADSDNLIFDRLTNIPVDCALAFIGMTMFGAYTIIAGPREGWGKHLGRRLKLILAVGSFREFLRRQAVLLALGAAGLTFLGSISAMFLAAEIGPLLYLYSKLGWPIGWSMLVGLPIGALVIFASGALLVMCKKWWPMRVLVAAARRYERAVRLERVRIRRHHAANFQPARSW